MLYASGARIIAEDNRPKDATLRELLDETDNAILQAIGNGDYSTTVIIQRFVPRGVRKTYKSEMKKLGYRVSCDWDDWASIIHIRW